MTKLRVANDELEASVMERLRALLDHSDIAISNNYILTVKRLEAHFDQDNYWRYDFSQVQLPGNAIYEHTSLLINHPELIATIVLSVQEYLNRCTNSKSRTERAQLYLFVSLRFIEYVWLQNIVDLKRLCPRHVEHLPRLLAQGGWWKALELGSRIESLPLIQYEALTTSKKPYSLHQGQQGRQRDLQLALGSSTNHIYNQYRKWLKNKKKTRHMPRALFFRI